MNRTLFTSSGLPEYHRSILIVQTRPRFAEAMIGAASAASAASAAGGAGGSNGVERPGVDLLVRMASFGAVRRMTLLGPQPTAPAAGVVALAAGGAFAGTLASWARSSGQQPPAPRGAAALAGTALVELDSETAADEVCERLRADESIAAAAPVPARYLLATRKSRGGTAKSGARKTTRKTTTGGRMKGQSAQRSMLPAAIPPAATFWNLARIRLPEARASESFREADAIRVAVLDTGIERDHPDLAGRVAGYRFEHPHQAGVVGPEDIVGHGTHVAGTIAANPGNGLGVEGITGPELHVWKIFSDEAVAIPSLGAFLYIVDPAMYRIALADCADEGIDVVNLSIGGPAPPDAAERLLFDALAESGTTVVAAMGNERRFGSPTSYPAAIPGVVAVGATKLDDGVASFSNRGAHIALCAPGVAIWSTLPTYSGRSGFEAVPDGFGGWKEGKPMARDTDYDAWDGTSMATPHVAAAAALLLAQDGPTPPHVVKSQLMAAAEPVAGMGGASFHPDYGAGRLNLERLL